MNILMGASLLALAKSIYYIKDGVFLDIHLFFNRDKKIKIDMIINYLLRQSMFSLLGETHL